MGRLDRLVRKSQSENLPILVFGKDPAPPHVSTKIKLSGTERSQSKVRVKPFVRQEIRIVRQLSK